MTAGNGNTADGRFALWQNQGNYNTGVGYNALVNNTVDYSTAAGAFSLTANTSGNENTAVGFAALVNNDVGGYNTALGSRTLFFNTSGSANTATGELALFANTTGQSNTATGTDTLQNNVTGNENTATGYLALGSSNGDHNTATGAFALLFSTGNSNIAVGYNAGANLTTGDNNIDIGNVGVANESDTVRIGAQGTQTRTFIAGIRGTPITGGVPVGVNSSGQLGVKPSSARYKEAIQPMDKASEAILALKPVIYRYKKDVDPEGVPQFGLVAEEVAEVNPDLVVVDHQGKPFSVRYEEVNAMLLNEFLKAHRRMEEQDKRIDQLTAQLKEQAALIQKVSDKVEMTRSAPQTVANNQK